MAKVTFLPINLTYEAREGETILDVAINNDVPMQHACGGFCACTTCHIHVKAGESNLGKMEEEEQDRLYAVQDFTAQSRLGCQAKVKGDVTVEIQNLE
jgi:ferredoxin, 2Fe-2S